jgi:hypothetical protein
MQLFEQSPYRVTFVGGDVALEARDKLSVEFYH